MAVLSFYELDNINYTFSQLESLNKTFDTLPDGQYADSSMIGTSYMSIRFSKVLEEIATLIGVSSSNINSIRAPQGSLNATGIGKINSSPYVIWNGDPLIYGVSYTDIRDSKINVIIEYINGDFSIKKSITGKSIKKHATEGSYRIMDSFDGNLDTIQELAGTRDLVELLYGERRGGNG